MLCMGNPGWMVALGALMTLGCGSDSDSGGGAKCTPNGARITGTLDGAAVDEVWPTDEHGFSIIMGTQVRLRRSSEFAVLYAEGDVTPEPAKGDSVTIPGWLLGPGTTELVGANLRAGQVTFDYADFQGAELLGQLSSLGPWPGTPVSGTLEICLREFGANAPCNGEASSSSGTLDGIAMDGTYTGFSSSSGYQRDLVKLGQGELTMIAHKSFAVLMTGPSSAIPGAIFAVDSVSKTEGTDATRWTLGSVSRLSDPTSAPLAGELSIGPCK